MLIALGADNPALTTGKLNNCRLLGARLKNHARTEDAILLTDSSEAVGAAFLLAGALPY